MTPQEKELISTLLTRLQAASTQVKDAEADGMIRQALMQQPDAPYFLVQTVLIQDLSLHNAQSRIAELEGQLSQAKLAPPAPASTSFLGSLFGHRDPPQQAAASVPPSGPWNRGPQTVPPQQTYAQPGYPPQGAGQPGYGQPGYGQAAGGGMLGGGMLGGGGGGFLRSAAATAAGVAGGALLFEGIQSMFGHGYANSLGGAQAGMTPGLGETVINNYYGDSGGQDGAGASGGQDYSGGDFSGGDAGYDNASDNSGGDFGGGDSGGDFGGGDFGGGDSGGSSSC